MNTGRGLSWSHRGQVRTALGSGLAVRTAVLAQRGLGALCTASTRHSAGSRLYAGRPAGKQRPAGRHAAGAEDALQAGRGRTRQSTMIPIHQQWSVGNQHRGAYSWNAPGCRVRGSEPRSRRDQHSAPCVASARHHQRRIGLLPDAATVRPGLASVSRRSDLDTSRASESKPIRRYLIEQHQQSVRAHKAAPRSVTPGHCHLRACA